jgi:hypothetical protein
MVTKNEKKTLKTVIPIKAGNFAQVHAEVDASDICLPLLSDIFLS